MGFKTREFKTYSYLIADDSKNGMIRIQSNEGVAGAVRRDYVNPSTKEEGFKFELCYHEYSGKIKFIDSATNTFNVTELRVTFAEESEEDVILKMPVDSVYALDFLEKLPNVDLRKELTIKPYNFKDKNGRLCRGMSLSQGENKITSFFKEKDANDKWVLKHGFPPAPTPTEGEDKVSSKAWNFYFGETVAKFLMLFLKTNIQPLLDTGFDTSAAIPASEVAGMEEFGTAPEVAPEAPLEEQVGQTPFGV